MNLEKKTAGDAAQAVSELAQCPAFENWFLKNIKRMADELGDEILNNDELSAEARELKRQKRLTLIEVMNFPAEAKASAEMVLANVPKDSD